VLLKAGATFGGWGLVQRPEPWEVATASELANHQHEKSTLAEEQERASSVRLFTLHVDVYRKVRKIHLIT
jgi:hypothetical protein